MIIRPRENLPYYLEVLSIFDVTQRGPRLFGDMPQIYSSGVPARGRDISADIAGKMLTAGDCGI